METLFSGAHFIGRLLSAVKMVSIEPVVLMEFFSNGMLSPIFPRAMRTKCEDLYLPDVNASYTQKQVDDYVQRKVVMWGMVSQIPGIPLSVAFGALMGAHSDRHGRQLRLAVSVAAEMASYCVKMLAFSHVLGAPIWLVPASFWLTDACGGPGAIILTCAAFLADSVVDKQQVAVRIGYSQGCRLCGMIAGALVVSLCYGSMPFSSWFMVAMSVNLGAVLWTLFRIPQAEPQLLNHTLKAITDGDYGVERTAERIKVHSSKVESAAKGEESTLKTMWTLYRNAFKTVFQKRAGYKRLLVLCSITIFCSLVLSIIEGQVSMGVYTMQRPLSWQPDQYAQWAYTTKLLDAIGTVVGIHVMKKCFKWPDTYVILVGLTSTIAQIVPIALVQSDWHMYVGSVLGMFDGVTISALSSYGNHLLGPQEMGRFMTAGHVLSNVVVFSLHGFVLQPLYMATLDTFPGCYLLVTAGIQLATLLLVVVVHVVTVKTDAFEDRDTKDVDDTGVNVPMSEY